MIEVQNTLVSLEIIEEHFVCDLKACKGACCVEGDAGAPLLDSEIPLIEKDLEEILPFVDIAGQELIRSIGFYTENKTDNESETTCVNSAQCSFVHSEAGMIKCGIEQAYYANKTDFLKPISCHLYPIRLSQVGKYVALNYHKWEICSPACNKGKNEKVAIYEFLKEPLIRAFGEEWFKELSAIAVAYNNQKDA